MHLSRLRLKVALAVQTAIGSHRMLLAQYSQDVPKHKL